MFFFTRYFVLKFAFASFPKPVAIVLVSLGYYFLMRNMALFLLAAKVSPGVVSDIKFQSCNFEKRRQIDVQTML